MDLKRSLRLSCLTLCLVGVTSAGLAQNPPGRWHVLTVDVRPGMNGQFVEFMTAFKEAADEIDYPMYWLTSQSAVGGTNNYTFHRYLPTGWNELEVSPGGVLGQVHNDREVERLLGLYNASAAHASSAGYNDRPDLSREGPEPTVVDAVTYIDVTVHQGMNQQFEEYVRQIITATDAVAPDIHWTMRSPSHGADNAYRVVIAYEDWADIDAPGTPVPQRLIDHFGAARGAKIWAEGQEAIERIDTSLRRTHPDLTRWPPP